MNYVAPSAPQTIGGVLDNWLRLFRSSFSRCWTLALIAAVAGIVLQAAFAPAPAQPGESMLDYLRQMGALGQAPRIFGADIIFWLILLVVNGALLMQQWAVIGGRQPPSFGGSLATSLRRLPGMVLGVVLLVLIVIVVMLPVAIGAGVLIALKKAGHDPLALTAGVSLGTLALVAFLIYLSVRLEFWLPALIVEGCGGAASLGHSWRLVKGHWWRVVEITFVAGIVIWIISMAVGGAAGLLAGVLSGHGTTSAEILYRVRFGASIAPISRIVTAPLFTAVWLVLYQDLKLRRQGEDLATRVGALSSR